LKRFVAPTPTATPAAAIPTAAQPTGSDPRAIAAAVNPAEAANEENAYSCPIPCGGFSNCFIVMNHISIHSNTKT